MKKKEDTKLVQLLGCEGCKKSCKYQGRVAIEVGNSKKFGCNSSK